MIIPIGTDNQLRQTPVVNYALIALNFAIYFFVNILGDVNDPTIRVYLLHPKMPMLHQFITSAFLHAGPMHIIGNMLFLYIFGNNVNDKLGHLGYSLFYLGGAVFSGLGHAVFDVHPVLGASGAVAAVTGAYMVLFPKTNILVLYIIIFIGTIEVPALYFILFKLIIYDNMIEPGMTGIGNVAYTAHLAGYVFGIGVPLIMLALKLLPHSHFDLWALLDRWRRRQEYRQVVNRGYDAYNPRHKVKAENVEVSDSGPVQEHSGRTGELRKQISDAYYAADMDKAAALYMEMIQGDRNQVLPQQQQLDIANKLMHDKHYQAAAVAYEGFIQYYGKSYPFIEQIELMLGLNYSRYLKQKDRAITHLEAALDKLNDAGQRKMCEAELERLRE